MAKRNENTIKDLNGYVKTLLAMPEKKRIKEINKLSIKELVCVERMLMLIELTKANKEVNGHA